MGTISGNIVGGILEDPKEKGLITSGVFADYPFLLPNAIASLMGLISLLMVYPTLEETLKKSDLTTNMLGTKQRGLLEILTDHLVYKSIIVGIILATNSTAFHELCTL